ncbi:MAG: GNAT family N-acetyltransferase [Helicobacteraceae bacterium]|jgi:RimJ/RimL family protein N-acetyltransferase|nr:GNAT family N-acetyltransferase [Helicobacteraceae bacterium]
MLNYCFDNLKLEKLNCEVIEGNLSTLKLHGKFMFRQEGFIRENVVKEGRRIGVHLLGVTRGEWDVARVEIARKYDFIFSKYQTTFSGERAV